MRLEFLAATAALALVAGAATAATVTVLDSSVQAAGNDAHIYASNFRGTTPAGATWSVNPLVTPPPGNEPGIYKSPFANTPIQETQTYFSVFAEKDGNAASAPQTLTYNTAQNVFYMLWGSIDSYNTLSFNTGESFTGTQIHNMLGLGGSPANFETVALLKFTNFDNPFTSVTFNSSQAAFEFALKPIPVPAAGFLLLGGLGGLVALKRRKDKKAA